MPQLSQIALLVAAMLQTSGSNIIFVRMDVLVFCGFYVRIRSSWVACNRSRSGLLQRQSMPRWMEMWKNSNHRCWPFPHSVPTQLAAIDGRASASGNDLIGKEQVNTQLRAPADCRIRQADGTSKNLSMTACCSAVGKMFLSGFQDQLTNTNATAVQKRAALRALGVPLNGVWSAARPKDRRVLLSEDGQKLKYTPDPFIPQQDITWAPGTTDRCDARRRTSRPPGKLSVRLYSHM